jgi:sec-independent protein translocase protein TatB
MLDVGFSELVVIGVVALVVIGPERLPKVARTMGHLLGRLQRYVSGIKADITREMDLDELRKMQTKIEDSVRNAEQAAHNEATKAEAELRTIAVGMGKPDPEPTVAPEPMAMKDEVPGAPAASSAQPTSPQLELGLEAKSSTDTDGRP